MSKPEGTETKPPAGTPPPAGTTQTPPPAPSTPPQPETVTMTIAEAFNRINVLEENNKALERELNSVKGERDQANQVLDGQIRAEYLKKVRGISHLPEQQLQRMGTKELENLIKANDMLRHTGTSKSIQFAVDEPNGNEGLIDLYGENEKRYRENRR